MKYKHAQDSYCAEISECGRYWCTENVNHNGDHLSFADERVNAKWTAFTPPAYVERITTTINLGAPPDPRDARIAALESRLADKENLYIGMFEILNSRLSALESASDAAFRFLASNPNRDASREVQREQKQVVEALGEALSKVRGKEWK